jgi:hypothetical protein
LTDVEVGSQIQVFSDYQIVSILKFYSHRNDLFFCLSGSKGALNLWDIGANKVVYEYFRDLGIDFRHDVEAYTFQCIRYHPVEANLVDNSNGNYIAMFTYNPPFKLNNSKSMKFQGFQFGVASVKILGWCCTNI